MPTPNVAGGAWYRPRSHSDHVPSLTDHPVLGSDIKVATRGRLATGANVCGTDPDCGPARAHCRLGIRMPSFVPVPGHLGAGRGSRAQSGASTLELPAGSARPWQQKGDLEILVFRVAAGKGQTPHATPQSRTSGSRAPGRTSLQPGGDRKTETVQVLRGQQWTSRFYSIIETRP